MNESLAFKESHSCGDLKDEWLQIVKETSKARVCFDLMASLLFHLSIGY